jgi:hypothetical protein
MGRLYMTEQGCGACENSALPSCRIGSDGVCGLPLIATEASAGPSTFGLDRFSGRTSDDEAEDNSADKDAVRTGADATTGVGDRERIVDEAENSGGCWPRSVMC